jgi:hypothetical protein
VKWPSRRQMIGREEHRAIADEMAQFL